MRCLILALGSLENRIKVVLTCFDLSCPVASEAVLAITYQTGRGLSAGCRYEGQNKMIEEMGPLQLGGLMIKGIRGMKSRVTIAIW